MILKRIRGEAGTDYFAAADAVPYELLEARYNPMRGQSPDPDPRHDWGLLVKSRSGDLIAAAQARVIGGGSSVNAMMSLRGVEADHREWVEEGNDEWTWEEALAAYIALEDDAAPGSFHGKGGPWSISRHHWQQHAAHVAPRPGCRGRGSCGFGAHGRACSCVMKREGAIGLERRQRVAPGVVGEDGADCGLTASPSIRPAPLPATSRRATTSSTGSARASAR